MSKVTIFKNISIYCGRYFVGHLPMRLRQVASLAPKFPPRHLQGSVIIVQKLSPLPRLNKIILLYGVKVTSFRFSYKSCQSNDSINSSIPLLYSSTDSGALGPERLCPIP